VRLAAASRWKPAEPPADSGEVRVASSEGAASWRVPASWGEVLQKAAASIWKPGKASPDSDEVSIAALDVPEGEATTDLHLAKPDSMQSAPLPEAKTEERQQLATTTEAPAKPAGPTQVQESSAAALQKPQEQQQPQPLPEPKAESSQIAAASPPEKPAPQAQPAQTASLAPSEPTKLEIPVELPAVKPEPSPAAVSTLKPSAPSAQMPTPGSQPPEKQTEQTAAISPAVVDQAALSVMTEPPAEAKKPAAILPQQPSNKAAAKLLEPEQKTSPTAPQAGAPKQQAALSPAPAEISAPEQSATQPTVKNAATAPKLASLDTPKATQDAGAPQALIGAKPQTRKASLKTEAEEITVQVLRECKALRRAFRRGTLVRGVDKAAYKRLLECERRIDAREGRARTASRTSNQGASLGSGGSTGGSTGGSSGPGNSGGKGNGKNK
jgi:hypothetical protein